MPGLLVLAMRTRRKISENISLLVGLMRASAGLPRSSRDMTAVALSSETQNLGAGELTIASAISKLRIKRHWCVSLRYAASKALSRMSEKDRVQPKCFMERDFNYM